MSEAMALHLALAEWRLRMDERGMYRQPRRDGSEDCYSAAYIRQMNEVEACARALNDSRTEKMAAEYARAVWDYEVSR
jgi:hypothetical protein